MLIDDSPPRLSGVIGPEPDEEAESWLLRFCLGGERYYDPVIGRRISQDPIGNQGSDPNLFPNQYLPVANNPINRIDPSGQDDAADQKKKQEEEEEREREAAAKAAQEAAAAAASKKDSSSALAS